MAKYVYVETFGCQMNVADSEKMLALLAPLGYQPVDDPDRADLVLLNTCSVRARAERKVYGHLGRYKRAKTERPLLLGVTGCVAQQEGERMLQQVPHLDLVLGTHNLHRLPELVTAAERGERRTETALLDNGSRLDLFPTMDAGSGASRFITIMQGCDNFCSYCIVPYVRGRELSRRSGEILAEIRQLAESGVREVTLLGQNVNSYGLKGGDELDFPGLLRQVARIDGIQRVRFTTSHPKDVSPGLLACFAEEEKLCGHLHLPAQAGSDRVLAAMGRGYTRKEYLELVAALRRARPGLLLTGDMIVGFPGETAAEFAETLSLMDEVGYADLFSFIYSSRPETAAASLPDPVTYVEKQQRLAELQERQRQATIACHQSLVGSRQQVLVEGESRRGGQLYGRTDGNRVINFPAPPTLLGEMVTVQVVRAHQTSLLGELAGEGPCVS